jgi:hypothetical protein
MVTTIPEMRRILAVKGYVGLSLLTERRRAVARSRGAP